MHCPYTIFIVRALLGTSMHILYARKHIVPECSFAHLHRKLRHFAVWNKDDEEQAMQCSSSGGDR